MDQKFENILKEGLEKCLYEIGIKDFNSAKVARSGFKKFTVATLLLILLNKRVL